MPNRERAMQLFQPSSTNPMQQAQKGLGQAAATLGGMTKESPQTDAPSKTMKGATMSAATLGMTGYQAAASSMLGSAGAMGGADIAGGIAAGESALAGGSGLLGLGASAPGIGWAAAGLGLALYFLS